MNATVLQSSLHAGSGAPGFTLLPYAQLVLLAGIAWVVRELVAKQGIEQRRAARDVLEKRLELVYGPLNHIVGEILYLLQAGQPVPIERQDELRLLLRTHSHHLRPEHYRFCVGLLFGRPPTRLESLWHRHSVHTEVEKLRHVIYGPAGELESALTAQPLGVLWRWSARLSEYLVAASLWVAIFTGLVWLVIRGGAAPKVSVAVLLIVTGTIWALRQIALLVTFRRRYSVQLLRPAKRGDRGQHVRLLQAMLQLLEYDVGRGGADGIFGIETERALRAYQLGKKVHPSGRVDLTTRNLLYRDLQRQ